MNSDDTKVGFVAGFIGGMIKVFILIPEGFIADFFKTILFAVISGVCGIVGKDIYVYFKKAWYKLFKKK